jgi:hypothetical protein
LQAAQNGASSLIWDSADNLAAAHDLADGHRNSPGWDGFQIGEPTFAHLLAAASLVQVYNDIRVLNLKIGWRVIERQVPVFADADQRQVDRILLQQIPHPATFSQWIASPDGGRLQSG